MKLNLLTEESPFSFTFSRSFRVGGDLSEQRENFLTPPRIDEDDAARVLFSSHGEFKIDGKSEELPIEQRGPERDKDATSILSTGLRRLSGITNNIKSIQENIEKGEYGSDQQSKAAEDELTKLREEYDRVVNSENFRSAVEAVKKVRADLTGLTDDELYDSLDGQRPLIGGAVQELANKKDASLLNRLSLNLDQLLEGVSEGASVKSIELLQESIAESSAIDNDGKEIEDDSGQLELALSDLQDTVRRLRFLKEGQESDLFSPEQLESVKSEERELNLRYREVLASDAFSEIIGALEKVSSLRQGQGGTPAAASFAEQNKGLLGGAVSNLLSDYRFGDLNKLNESLLDIGAAATNIEELNSDQLGRLSDTIGDAKSIVSGDTLEDEESKVIKRSIDLYESQFDKKRREYASTLVDEIEDFFDITADNANGSYLLIKEKHEPKGSLLDLLG